MTGVGEKGNSRGKKER
jgi:hypothetical protein